MLVDTMAVSIPIGFFQALQPRSIVIFVNIPFSFNPYRVFSGLATLLQKCTELDHLIGFNPYRVFSGLATGRRVDLWRRGDSFNPYRVFSGLATLGRRCPWLYNGEVSIPIGFFQALQPLPTRRFLSSARTFQSLSGFFRPCNGSGPQDRNFGHSVSIPIGFFQALQLGDTLLSLFVDIAFQSLSGFFRPCNRKAKIEHQRSRHIVSIPIGFFQALQL